MGHSLLCYKNWLINNAEGIEKHYKKIKRYKIDKTISNSVSARYFTTELLYANANGLDKEDILATAREFYLSKNYCNENLYSLNCFEVIISEALILITQYDEAMFYISEILKKVKRSMSSHIDVALYENICLFKAVVFANTGRNMKAY